VLFLELLLLHLDDLILHLVKLVLPHSLEVEASDNTLSIRQQEQLRLAHLLVAVELPLLVALQKWCRVYTSNLLLQIVKNFDLVPLKEPLPHIFFSILELD